MLAYFLLNSEFTHGRAISLLAYSAGSVVAMNCCKALKTMHDSGVQQAGIVLHDMQIWAGSFVIDPNRKYEERMEVSKDCSVLAGCLTNLYSEGHIVLRYG